MRLFIPLLLLCVSLPSMARQFDVEIVIFKRTVDAEQTMEAWPNTQPTIDMRRVAEFTDIEYQTAKGVTLLPENDYQLNSQIRALQNHAGFEVLFHKAWRQGDEGSRSAPTFHITAGKDYSGEFVADVTTSQGNTESITGTVLTPLFELDGKVQVYVQHYLYADIELDLKQPSVRNVTIADTELNEESFFVDSVDGNVQIANMAEISPTFEQETFLKSYRFDQKRRMRSGETHYFDNPLMGVILQVRRVEQTTTN
ncbi:hypothetical protein HGP28_09125 [Vibrio sp. SM6]|uniref:Peptidoglycan-binding protein CsiV n=1 Tax=Vibrio agarilyticus TaxID=2726741 RepID=A0A7X8TQT2_9VIBR|nr:peptidoglycan binding protein CsiV [Vibrio agarilyticus]NLS13049.1 hypothetical protein [Vibrio agarilyticus]